MHRSLLGVRPDVGLQIVDPCRPVHGAVDRPARVTAGREPQPLAAHQVAEDEEFPRRLLAGQRGADALPRRAEHQRHVERVAGAEHARGGGRLRAQLVQEGLAARGGVRLRQVQGWHPEQPVGEDQLEQPPPVRVGIRLPVPGRAVRKAYPDADSGRLFELVFSDWLFRMPTLHLAQAHAASGGRTFLYELRAEAPGNGGVFGACHALDVPLVFGSAGEGLGAMLTGPRPPAEFLAVGDLMRAEWLTFATCGDPGWPVYGTERRTTRVYDLQPDVVPYPEDASMHLWERHRFDALGLVS